MSGHRNDALDVKEVLGNHQKNGQFNIEGYSMKITKKSLFASRMGLALVGIFLAGQANAAVYVLSGDMDVFQALTNPSNVGNGTGTIAGDYDDVTNSLNYSITWMDLTSAVTNMHFHVAPVGMSGGVDLGIPSPWSSPQVGSATLTASQETNLLSGRLVCQRAHSGFCWWRNSWPGNC